MKHILPLLLVAAALPTLRAADVDAGDQAIRELAGRYYDAFASKDVDGFMALWSDKSPDYEHARQVAGRVFAETGPIEVRSLTVLRAARDGDAAWVRVRVELAGDDRKTGQPHLALSHANQVLELIRQGERWKVLRSLEAERWLGKRLFLARTRGDRLRLLDDHNDLVGLGLVRTMLGDGDTLAKQNQFDKASRLQDLAFEIARGLGDGAVLARCHLYRGLSLELQGRHGPALASFQEALRLSRQANDRAREEAALQDLGVVHEALGQYPEALRHYEDALALGRELGDRSEQYNTLLGLGHVFHKMDDCEKALERFQVALQIAQEKDDRTGEARALLDIGLVDASTGRYAEALTHYQDALRIARDGGDRAGEALALDDLGSVCARMGQSAEALQQFKDALTISRQIGDRVHELEPLYNIGLLDAGSKRYAEALERFQEALQIARGLGDRHEESHILLGIGLVYQERGKSSEALDKLQEALEIARTAEDRSNERRTLEWMGYSYRKAGRYDEALQCSEEGLQLAESGGDVATAAGCRLNKGLVHKERKQWRQAAEDFREAVRDVEALRSNVREMTLQTSYFSSQGAAYFQLADCLLELDRPAEAFAALEQRKARGLMDLLQEGKVDLRRGMTDEEKRRERELQDRLTALGVQREDLQSRHADNALQTAAARDLDRARQDGDAFRRDLFLRRPDVQTRRAAFEPASLADLGPALFAGRPGLVVFTYLTGDEETLLFVLTAGDPDGAPARLSVHHIPLDFKLLLDAVESFREGCSDPAKGEPDSDDLYRWLIAPAADELKGAKQVVIVPSGGLYMLPFQALRDPDGKYLIERFAVSYAPSVTALVKMSELAERRRKEYAGRPSSLLAVGISDFGRREKPLPAAEKEAQAVADAFGGGAKLLSGAEATRTKLEAAWSGRRYLHFATHGRLNPDAPLYSSLVLSADGDEGALYARDLVDADVPAELVVMSACHTGEGRRINGEGLLGMSWAWFAAGVPSVVASQWSVGDASTAQLMKIFYARLSADDSKAEALRQAELTLLKDPATRHPFFWAPFVLVGDDR